MQRLTCTGARCSLGISSFNCPLILLQRQLIAKTQCRHLMLQKEAAAHHERVLRVCGVCIDAHGIQLPLCGIGKHLANELQAHLAVCKMARQNKSSPYSASHADTVMAAFSNFMQSMGMNTTCSMQSSNNVTSCIAACSAVNLTSERGKKMGMRG